MGRRKKNGYEFIITEKDVLVRKHFGRFEVIKTKKGMLFKTYTGYKVFVEPYVVDVQGKARETSLYSWLNELLEASAMYEGHEAEKLFDDDSMSHVTKGDLLDMMKITTEANLLYPTTVFIDRDLAAKKALEYMDWLSEQVKNLQDTIKRGVDEDEDLKANAEFNAKAENEEYMREIIKNEESANV